VTVKDDTTSLAATDRLGNLAGGYYGGVGGGVGGGMILVPIGATFLVPVLGPLFFAGWFGLVYAGTRKLFKRAARRRAEALQRLFDAIGAEIESELRAR